MRTPKSHVNTGIGAGKQITTKRIIVVLLMLMCCSVVFADAPDNTTLTNQVTGWTNKLTGFMGSGWVKAIALIALVVEAIGIVVGGQQGGGAQVFKKLSPWIIGTIILLMASSVCSYLYTDFKIESL